MKRLIPCVLLVLSVPPIQAMPWQALQDEIGAVESGRAANAELVRRLEDIVQTVVLLTRAQRTKDANSLLVLVVPGRIYIEP